jgi:TonB family protein
MENVKQSLGFLLGLAGIIAGGTTAADEANAPPQEQQPGVKTRARMDRPLIIYEDEYPPESRDRHEQGMCAIRVEVDADGVIRAKQLVISTGFSHLDVACLNVLSDPRVASNRWIPATLDGKPVASWLVFRLTWWLGSGNNAEFRTNMKDYQLEVPVVQEDYPLKVGPNFYPAESLAMKSQGDCTVRAVVRRVGTPDSVGLAKSTGFAALDEACLAAIREAPFVPGNTKHGPPINVVDIYMSWRLPRE